MTITPGRIERTERDAVATLRHGLVRLVALIAALASTLCLVAVVLDLADHTDDWDGLVAVIAAFVGAPCLVICAVAVWGMRTRSRLAAGVTAGLVVAAGLAIGSQSPWGVAPLLLGATLLVTVFVAPTRTR